MNGLEAKDETKKDDLTRLIPQEVSDKRIAAIVRVTDLVGLSHAMTVIHADLEGCMVRAETETSSRLVSPIIPTALLEAIRTASLRGGVVKAAKLIKPLGQPTNLKTISTLAGSKIEGEQLAVSGKETVEPATHVRQKDLSAQTAQISEDSVKETRLLNHMFTGGVAVSLAIG